MIALKERKLLANTGWLLVLQAINIVLPFITVPYVTRVFGVELYGVFTLALNWVTYFQLVIEYGFNLSATKKVVEADGTDAYCRLVSSVVSARLVLLAACFCVMLGLYAFSAVDAMQLGCMLVLFSMLLGIAIQLNWLFQGLQDMKVITIATAISRGFSVVLIFLLINNPSQLVLYSFFYSITFLASGLITHWFALRRYGIRMVKTSSHEIWEELKDGMPIFLSSAAGKIIGSVGITVLGAFSTSAVVGSYGAILKMPQMASMMFTPIGQALYPRVNEERMRSRRAAARLVFKMAVPTVALFAIGLAAMVLLRVPLIRLLFGDEYLTCADALIPLAVWVLFGIVNNYLGVQMLIPFGHQRLYSALMVADSLFALASNVVLGAAWGAMGVATAIAVSEVMLTLALVISLWKIAGSVHGVALGRKD